MKRVEIPGWTAFAGSLKTELATIGHRGKVLVRTFARTSLKIDNHYKPLEQVDRLRMALETGTDRDASSPFWNVKGSDHDHASRPVGKSPRDITYAYPLDASAGSPAMTKGLTANDAILVYDASKLHGQTKHEYWFQGDPRQAAMLIYTANKSDDRA